jgi:tRNA(fMet)-specific endonuclease VapC
VILLDTDVCIELLRGNANVIEKRQGHDEKVAISLLSIEIIHSDLEILRKFGKLKAMLGKSGNILADADIFIAASALVRCNLLITGNVSHFRRIDALRIDNWIR